MIFIIVLFHGPTTTVGALLVHKTFLACMDLSSHVHPSYGTRTYIYFAS